MAVDFLEPEDVEATDCGCINAPVESALRQVRAAASRERPPKVINVASIDGLAVNSAESHVCQASKTARVQLTQRLATRLIGDQIVVAGVAPGAFPSDMNVTARDHPEAFAALTPGPRRRLGGHRRGLLASRAGAYRSARRGPWTAVGSPAA